MVDRTANKVVASLLELNILNVQHIERELRNMAARAIHPQVKKWLATVARNYIINLGSEEMAPEYEPYTKKRPKGMHTDMPDVDELPSWAKEAVGAGSELHFFNPAQPRRRTLWQSVEHIVDWFNTFRSDDPVLNRLDRISFQHARTEAKKWRESVDANPWQHIVDRPPVLKDYGNGMRWVKLSTFPHFKRESHRNSRDEVPATSLGHCVGSSNTYFNQSERGTHSYYSLRDKNNYPLVTLEVEGDKNLLQAKGKRNQKPVPEAQPYIADIIRSKGWRIAGDSSYIDMDSLPVPKAA